MVPRAWLSLFRRPAADRRRRLLLSSDGASFHTRVRYRFDNGWSLQLNGTNLARSLCLRLSSEDGYARLSMQRVSWPRSAARGLPERRHGPRLQIDRAI